MTSVQVNIDKEMMVCTVMDLAILAATKYLVLVFTWQSDCYFLHVIWLYSVFAVTELVNTPS